MTVEVPLPPRDWLDQVTEPGERAGAGYGWQAGWLAGRESALQLIGDPVADPAPLGAIEAAVEADLTAMGADGALAEVARYLARAMDAGAGQATQAARLAQELRVTLGQLREIARDRDAGRTDDDPATPAWSGSAAVRDAEDTGPADVGAETG